MNDDKRAGPTVRTTFWSWRRLTGTTLILGCFLFMGGVGLIPRDAQGNFLVNLSLREQLLLISAQTPLFRWSFSLIITGVLVTILGLALFASRLRDAGDRIFSVLALVALVVGGVFMVIYLAFPLGVDPLAAHAVASTGVIPEYYLPLSLWTNVLFVVYTVLAFVALACYGGAVLSTQVLPRWVGWVLIVYSIAGLGFTGVTQGNVPPFLQHLMPIVIGILLLLPPARSAAGQVDDVAKQV
jgi:hypothetical protein